MFERALSPRRILWITICVSAMIVTATPEFALGQGKGFRLPGFGPRKETQQVGQLTNQSGPWLILCTSFVGEGAETRAYQVGEALREVLRAPIYVYKQEFDFTNKYQGMWYSASDWETDEFGNRRPKRKPTRTSTDSQFEEYAVLVGDFPSLEDGKCQKMLESIKHLQMDAAAFTENSADERNINEWREAIKKIKKGDKKGPLGSAFVIPNPMIPEDYFRQASVDETILELNRGIKNSLLDCPKNYSVRVASFRGSITMNLDEIEHEESKFNLLKRLGKPLDIEQSKLAQAGRKANILCEELRKLGIEAYEFHDRSESFVCVGAFDWVSRKDNFGGVEFNPEVEKTIMLFKGTVENMPGNQNSFAAKSLPALEKQGIAFDVQPVPVAVPRAPGAKGQTARGGLFGAQMR